ncbi:probable glutathione S-transferase 7 isoform X1 [Daphnia pulicaria]|uniref:probable glutathione S-transferase 7 isoform X1 n=1 Tax=Daphnia pulicaria TaxID=35523 RepID=UPI001EECD104|nr:probable glutathione S-transferase 7 isoform X1 [Daphnia pulicaria]
MAVYKLHYFDNPRRGRAELSRLILSQAGVPFEDVRFPHSEWPNMKPTTPFGQVPILEVNGQMLAQSNAIARYLARQHGLAGKDEWEQAQTDMYIENINDLLNAAAVPFVEKDPAKQKEMYGKFMTETIAFHVVAVEKQLKKNNTGNLVGDRLTAADLAYYALFSDFIEVKFGGAFLKDAPLLKSLLVRVRTSPNVKKWIDFRNSKYYPDGNE